ncbi:hypothetical protein K2173_019485 [Erythroxylum novogranatense]|uniref:DUF4283 domain-containing protein n=1 Tax=Erythroxylum novogranatense TaxID=1862640 RepID=A0AAV8UB41_9ROSI|nr:hypothetical protein K2173_019485 [Erythroxylum novogranatense]
MASLFIYGEEDERVVIGGKEIVEDRINYSMRLVERFHLDRNINFNAMKRTLTPLWRPFMGVTIHKEEDDMYLFQLYHEVDVHGLRSGFMSEHVAKKINNALGEFVESNPKNYEKSKKKFMRLRNQHDVRRTIHQLMRLRKDNRE